MKVTGLHFFSDIQVCSSDFIKLSDNIYPHDVIYDVIREMLSMTLLIPMDIFIFVGYKTSVFGKDADHRNILKT